MKRPARFTVLAMFALLAGGPQATLQAEDLDQRLEAASSYIELSVADMQLDQLATVSAQPLLDAVRARQPLLYAEKEQKLREIAESVLLEAMTQSLRGLDGVLAQTFTLEELKVLLAFSTSPTGRSIARKLPTYLAAIQPAMQMAIEAAVPELLQRFRDEGVNVE